MPIFLCYDPYKRTTSWTQEKHQSMVSEFARRRIKYHTVASPEELASYLKYYKDEPSSLVLFPSFEPERQYLFDRYGQFDVHRIIFSHHDLLLAESNCSSVMSDFYGDMAVAIKHLRQRGCKRIALFGVNMGGYHDKLRADTFIRLSQDKDPLIFYGPKAAPCLQALFACKQTIDAFICINDFHAFALFTALNEIEPDWQKKIAVLSFADTVLSGLCSPSLSSISFNYIDGGKEVLTIHNALCKNPRMAHMHILMRSRLAIRETTAVQNPEGICFFTEHPYTEEELHTLLRPSAPCMALEKLLQSSDETDLAIMHGLIEGATLTEIASRLYLTRDTIKYRVRKFKEKVKCENTSLLAALLTRWIDPAKLEEMIINWKKS